MKKNIYHIAVRVLLIVVMSLTSTGFTTVLGYCSMSKSSVCCCDSDHSGKTPAPSSVQIVEPSDFSCYSVRIVGGLNDIGGVVPEIVALKVSLAALDAVAPEFLSTPPTRDIAVILPLDFRDEPPAKSDICILVRSLLI